MKYGYTIIYVASVEATLDFYQKAFGFTVKFLHDSKDYGELQTGETVLAFASHQLGEASFAGEYAKSDITDKPFGFELAFISDDVLAAYQKAVSAGAVPLKEPEEKPWGQMVAYLRAMEGVIVELCSPMG